MSTAPDTSVNEESLYRRVTWRLIPFLFLCYVLSFLDRVNVGFAKLKMLSDLGFSDTVYSLGAGIFFIGYFIFEVPSNLLLERVGARIWITRIMVTWGLISSAMMFVKSPASFYALRFLLGVAEAGFFPGIILYLTYWYPPERRGRIVSLLMMALPVAGMVGGPLSGWILKSFDGLHGMAGWQWLFLLEGLPSVVVGTMVPLLLRDGIRSAKWLSEAEKRTLEFRLSRSPEKPSEKPPLAKLLMRPRLLLLSLIYFCVSMGLYGAVTFWLPQLVADTGVKDMLHVGLLTALPNLCAIPAMWLVGRSSDRRGERRRHFAISALCGAAGLVLSVMAGQHVAASVLFLSVATSGIMAALPVFWSMGTARLGASAAAGIALINSIGGLAGFSGPSAVAWIKGVTGGGLAHGMYFIAGCLMLGALLTLFAIPAESEPK
ncbi:MAG: MFS transporter [Verrucomicrobiaceae bacterium]|nr:MAG: MFS transporter [Verrucomicrobiaceae bacterium]